MLFFNEILQFGTPVAGEMGNSVVGMVQKKKKEMHPMSMTRLKKERKVFNEKAISMMRDAEFSVDMVQLALEDKEKGFMTTPIESAEENRQDLLI